MDRKRKKMFESKTWYREVTVLTIISSVIEFSIGFVIGLVLFSLGKSYLVDSDTSDIYFGIISVGVFIGLAVWRIRKKVLTVKEAAVLFLIIFILYGSTSLLFPEYIQVPLSIGIVYLLIWIVHSRAVKRISDQDLTAIDLR